MTIATIERAPATVTLHMDEDTAGCLMAVLVGALNFPRNPWAAEMYRSLLNAGVDPPEETYDEVRAEIEGFIENTLDNHADDSLDDDELLLMDEDDDLHE